MSNVKALDVSEFRVNTATRVMKINGFSEKEMSELNSMDYREMKETVLSALDQRNNGIGSVWHNGYGVYTVWINNGTVYAEIGNSCD